MLEGGVNFPRVSSPTQMGQGVASMGLIGTLLS